MDKLTINEIYNHPKFEEISAKIKLLDIEECKLFEELHSIFDGISTVPLNFWINSKHNVCICNPELLADN